jgi:hypothetical protein
MMRYQAGERFRGSLLLVLGPRGRSVGTSRLVQVGSEGRIRSAPLPDIRSGTAPGGSATQSWKPGLAVDRSGARAFVVQAEAPVAEIDLRTFKARSHPLEPVARAADAVAGPTRHAIWLGGGLLALTGSDSHSSTGDPSEAVVGETPAGLTLVDTRRWRARTIDARTTDAVLVSGTLLASSYLFDSRTQGTSGNGLTGYSRKGRRRFHVYGREAITGVQPLGRKALVGAHSAIELIDARTGRRLHRCRRFTTSLLSGDAPFH